MNLSPFRCRLVYSVLMGIFICTVCRTGSLALVPGTEKKDISVEFRYEGAFEEEIEELVSVLEEAYSTIDGMKEIFSVSRTGLGRILVSFDSDTDLDRAYVRISDETARCFADFPERVNRPLITKGDNSDYPVFVAVCGDPGKEEEIRKLIEGIPGTADVTVGGTARNEISVEIDSGKLFSAGLLPSDISRIINEAVLSGSISVPDGSRLIFSSGLHGLEDFRALRIFSSGLRLGDLAEVVSEAGRENAFGRINGREASVIQVSETGERSTVSLCRELSRLAEENGCREIRNAGKKIAREMTLSFLLLAVCILLVFSAVLYGSGPETAFRVLAALAFCLAGGLATVSAFGFRTDVTVPAALCAAALLSLTRSRFPLLLSAALLVSVLYAGAAVRSLATGAAVTMFSVLLLSALCPGPHLSRPASRRMNILLLLVPLQLFPVLRPEKEAGFDMVFRNGTSSEYIREKVLAAEKLLLAGENCRELAVWGSENRISFRQKGGKPHVPDSSLFPGILFYSPERFGSKVSEAVLYGSSMEALYSNASSLVSLTAAFFPDAEIILNYGSMSEMPLITFSVSDSVSGLYPLERCMVTSGLVSGPVTGKLFLADGEHDIRCGSVPCRYPEEAAMNPWIGKNSVMGSELSFPAIYHRGRSRSLSFSVKGVKSKDLSRLVSDFPFSGDCRGEVIRQ